MRLVKVRTNDEVDWHVAGHPGPDYHTLCGCDADDPQIGHFIINEKPKKGQKVTCKQCFKVWEFVMDLNLKRSDFA